MLEGLEGRVPFGRVPPCSRLSRRWRSCWGSVWSPSICSQWSCPDPPILPFAEEWCRSRSRVLRRLLQSRLSESVVTLLGPYWMGRRKSEWRLWSFCVLSIGPGGATKDWSRCLFWRTEYQHLVLLFRLGRSQTKSNRRSWYHHWTDSRKLKNKALPGSFTSEGLPLFWSSSSPLRSTSTGSNWMSIWFTFREFSNHAATKSWSGSFRTTARHDCFIPITKYGERYFNHLFCN